ncbi:MAG: aquaporin [Planctomycetes bacterium]|nr:aquaporin [Planctomycetota bacterium]
MSAYQSLLHHWPEYAMEAALLGLFMVSACLFTALFEHPASAIRRRIGNAVVRRAGIGLAMGLTAVALIYSPWGQRSGAHMNPATTLTFFARGMVAPWDALFYVLAQMIGGALGVAAGAVLLRNAIRHEAIDFVVTMPGRRGSSGAFAGELFISFGMMFMVLVATNDERFAPYTGFFAGLLLLIYVAFEAPLSGMSLNPARSFASAIIARKWRGFWIYLAAPVVGMLLASAAYSSLPLNVPLVLSHRAAAEASPPCAKLNRCTGRNCVFECRNPAKLTQKTEAAPVLP